MSMQNQAGGLYLPTVAAPIDRDASPAVLVTGAGVEAAFSFSDFLDGAKKVVSTVAPIAGALAPAAGALLGI